MMEEILTKRLPDFQASVLIVDDIHENLQVLGKALIELDIELSYATNGMDALEAVSFNKPDLILLDVSMPGMTGFEVCEILKRDENTEDIPVVFLTAKTEPEDIISGFMAGGIDYITKPFNSKELIARVKSHLALSISKQIISAQNEDLKNLNKELKESLATKNKFFSIIAHDLKDPFQTLIGFSDVLLNTMEGREPEDIKRLVKFINQTSVHGFDLLNNLLEWSRAQTGGIKFNPVEFDLSRIVNEILLFLNASAEEKSIHLFSGIPNGLTLIADEKMIRTVIRNLVSNALKYTEVGGDVSLESNDLGVEFEISVSDTGLGIKEERLSQLFSTTNNISTPGTNQERGTGLGLLLCKEFVEINGGRIRATSEPGIGSRFSFTIPKEFR